MAEEIKVGCARPTGGPVGEPVTGSRRKTTAATQGGQSHDHSGEEGAGFHGAGLSPRESSFP